MKLLKALLPNLAVSLNLVLMIVIYLDMRNPMMGFLVGAPFVVLVAFCCICSISTAIILFVDYRKSLQKHSEKTAEKQ